MSNHMSAAEYRKLVVEPALKEEVDDQEFLKKIQGIDKKTTRKKDKVEVTHTQYGVKVLEGNKTVSEWKGELTPIKKPRKNEEDELTKRVADYCELLMAQGKVTAFSHIPNSTFTRSWSVKKRNSAMGVRPGVPDMLIVFKTGILFLELKRLKGGVVSPFQKEWIAALSATGKVTATVASGWDEAKQAIDKMLE